MDTDYLWRFLPVGYLVTVLLELPVLVGFLSRGHPMRRRLGAGVWLTACTYPVVVLVLPILIPSPRWLYVLVAELLAPGAECALFSSAFHIGRNVSRRDRFRDWAAIIAANLLSFVVGGVLVQSLVRPN
jgi:hypothetical protein